MLTSQTLRNLPSGRDWQEHPDTQQLMDDMNSHQVTWPIYKHTPKKNMHMNRYLPNCQRDSPSKQTDQTLKMLHSNSNKYVFYTFIKCYVPSGFSQVYPHESWNSITPPTLWEGRGAGRVRGSVISSILVGVPQQYTGDWTGCRSFIDMGRARRGQGGGGGCKIKSKKVYQNIYFLSSTVCLHFHSSAIAWKKMGKTFTKA